MEDLLVVDEQKKDWSEEESEDVLNPEEFYLGEKFYLGENYRLLVKPWMAIKRGEHRDEKSWRDLVASDDFGNSMNAKVALREVVLSEQVEIVPLGTATTEEIMSLLSNFDTEEYDQLISSGRLKCATDQINVGIKSVGLELCRIEDVLPIRYAYENIPGSEYYVGDNLYITTEEAPSELDNFPVYFWLGRSITEGTNNYCKWVKTIPEKRHRKHRPEDRWVFKIPTEIILKNI